MIHDAKVEVTCDGDGCTESEWLDTRATFDKWGSFLGYKLDDDEAAKELRELDWVVAGDKHYCSAECEPGEAGGA